jgi:hypothetical protein
LPRFLGFSKMVFWDESGKELKRIRIQAILKTGGVAGPRTVPTVDE